MICRFFVLVFHSEVVYNKCKRCAVGRVSEEAWGIGLVIIVFGEMFNELLFGQESCLRQSIHSFVYFEQN